MKRNKVEWIHIKRNLYEIDSIINEISSNKKIDTFIEPFSGGISGAIKLLPTLIKCNIKNLILNNVNRIIIASYYHTKENVNLLFEKYWLHEAEYEVELNENINKFKNNKTLIYNNMSDFYEKKRKLFNSSVYDESIENCALFLFLVNKSLNLNYSLNSKEEYISKFTTDLFLFDKKDRFNTFNNFSRLFSFFNVVFEERETFYFINKYKNLNNNSIFFFEPLNSINIDKKNKLSNSISFFQFYNLFENIIIDNNHKDNDIIKMTSNNKFKRCHNFIFKY